MICVSETHAGHGGHSMNSELSRPNNPLTPPQPVGQPVSPLTPSQPVSPLTPSHPWYGYATVVSRSQQVAALRATLIAVALLTALVLVIWV